jgi:carotenoid cleavage dioxygenase-like enzyme
MHSFGLTPQHAVLFAGPLLLAPLRLLWSERGFIRHFRYRPERGSRLYCIDRATGSVRTHRAPPFFVFHVIHAFERADETVMDVLAYDDPSVVESLSLASLRRGWPEMGAQPLRIVLQRNREEASVEPLSDRPFEFPTLHEQASDGHDYRNVWGAHSGMSGSEYRSAIIHLDPERGVSTSFEEGGFSFGEPLFVPRPQASSERDGALISVASHLTEPRSALVVLDAESLTVRAWGELDRPVPFSFHGCFLTEQAELPQAGQGGT